MITDRETNFVYFSSLLTIDEKYQPFWFRLKSILDQEDIRYGFLEGTKDIWCRDYMPVQIAENYFLQFRYFPSYLDENRYQHTRTAPEDINFSCPSTLKHSTLVLDGGNVVKTKAKAIVTERVFKENRNLSEEEVRTNLKEALQVEELLIIPTQPLDYTGHADGMVRFLNENQLLVNDFSSESPSWQMRFMQAIQKTGLEIITFPHVALEERNEVGDYTAKGCYINFAQIGNVLLLPFFDLPEDELALQKTEELFPNCVIYPVFSNEIAQHGGVLNCATWNTKTN